MDAPASEAVRQLLRYGRQPVYQERIGVPNPIDTALWRWLVTVGSALVAAVMGAGVAVGLRFMDMTIVLGVALLLLALVTIMLIGLKRFFLVVLIVDLVLSIDNHLFYQEAVGNLGSLGGLSISLGTLALIGLYALWLIESLLTRTRPKRARSSAVFWALAYVAITAVSTVSAASVELASFELLLLSEMLLLLVYFVFQVRQRNEIVFIVALLFIGLTVQGLITVYSAVSQQLFDFGLVTNYVDPSYRQGIFWRSGGTLGSPNVASAFFSMLLAMAFTVVMEHRRSFLTLLAYVGLTAGFIALIFTQSRGGWVAFAVAVAVILTTLAAQRRLRPGTLFAIGAILLISAPLSLPLILSRTVDDGGALMSRGPLNVISWHMITENPVMGVGPNNFALTAPDYITPDVSQYWFYTVHNKYLLVWAESGTLTLIAFIAFLLSSLQLAWLVVRQGDALFRPYALGIGAAIVGHMVHFGFDIFNSRTSIQLLWILVALLAAMASQGRSHSRASVATRRCHADWRWETM